MSVSIDHLSPFLVSELPPVPARRPRGPRLALRLRERAAARSFEVALRHANPGEYGDLLALARRG